MKRNGFVIIGLWVMIFNLALILALPAPLQAQSPGNKVDLALNRIGTSSDRIEPGQYKSILIELRNYSTFTVNNIRISAGVPEGWQVSLQPQHLDSLGAGESDIIQIDIVPGLTADSGYYELTVFAEANETRSQISLGLQVEGVSSFWLWVGAGIAGAAIVIFLMVYFLYGRQK